MLDTLSLLNEIFMLIISNFKISYKRYMHRQVNFDNKMIGILGPRGAGKTTFLLQYIQECDLSWKKKLYITADHSEIAGMKIYNIAKEFHKQGGKLLIIDEIHKYKNFESELKSIYDTFDLQIIFSGSSAIQLEHAKADLSRRAILYRINGLSFREFLELETGLVFESYTLEEILDNHQDITFQINKQIKPYEYFYDYLKYGFYPFYREDIATYPIRLNETINAVLEVDLPMVFNVEPRNIIKLKKLVSVICQSEPYEINMTKLAAQAEINRNTLYNYLFYLQAGSIIKMLFTKGSASSFMTKPEKLYLHNPNLNYSYCKNAKIGTIREEFLINQLGVGYEVKYTSKGDICVNDRYVFEIGGENKKFTQIRGVDNSYLILDGLEFGRGNKIPIWLFGFLY
ncbi:ATP-binding protein [Desulfovulcanus sp.]